MRQYRARRPNFDLGPDFDLWAKSIEEIVYALPRFSIISTPDGPNSSGVTGDMGVLAIEIGSSATKLWQKFSSSTATTGWSAYSWIG